MIKYCYSEINKRTAQLCREYGIPGVAVGYIYQGHTQINTYGVTNSFRQKPVNADTGFEIASLSKSFTAFAVQGLIFDGRWSLNTSITQLDPSFDFRLEGKNMATMITIGDLLYHTSGLSNELVNMTKAGNQSIQSFVKCLQQRPLANSPGTSYRYTSLNYDILAYLIERETNRPFFEFLKESVLEPLNLLHTDTCETIINSKASCGHKWFCGRPWPHKSRRHEANISSGYLISTMNDMVRWLQVQLGLDSNLPQRYKNIIHMSQKENRLVEAFEGYSYASGWKKPNRLPQLYHDGNNPGFSAFIRIRFNDKIGICVLSNINTNAVGYIADAILRMLKGYEQAEYEKDAYPGIDRKMTWLLCAACTAILAWLLLRQLVPVVTPILNVLTMTAAAALQYTTHRVITKGRTFLKLSIRIEWAPLSYVVLLLANLVLFLLPLIDLCCRLLEMGVVLLWS